MSQKCCTFRYGILWFDLLADLIRNNALMGCAPSLSFLSSVEIVTSQMGEESVYFFSVNRNKKVQYQLFLRSILMNMPQSITVDFSTDKGKEIIKQVSQLHLFN